MTFTNSAVPKTVSQDDRKHGHYAYDRPSPYLRIWSRLFQHVISQAGTFLLTRKFHDRNFAIHKTEGGVNLPGIGELTLYEKSCSWDSYAGTLEARADPLYRLSGLITNVVLGWNPEDPIESLLRTAAINANTEVKALRAAIDANPPRTILNGNALWTFFGANDHTPIDRTYWRWCLSEIDKKTPAEIDALFASMP